MFVSSSEVKKPVRNNYQREYNIIAIISLIFPILSFLSLITGSIILFSYVSIIDKRELFIELLSEKNLYAISFASFLMLSIIIIYSIATISFSYIKYKKTDSKLKLYFCFDIILFNLLFLAYIIFSSSLNDNVNEWTSEDYVSNFIIFLGLFLPTIYFIVRIEELNYEFSIENFLSLLTSIILPIMILLWGYKANTLGIHEQYFLFWFLPVILSSITSYILLDSNITPKSRILTIIFIFSAWMTIISFLSPLIMGLIGIGNNKTNYCLREYETKNISKKGNLLISIGEKYVFLEEGKPYKESFILEKEKSKCK